MCCSKLYNSVNIEKTVLGEVFELPKLSDEEKLTPFDLIIGFDRELFNKITNLKK